MDQGRAIAVLQEAGPAFELGTRYGLAFSGGCDSSYLLAEASRVGADVKAYLVRTAFQADFELDDARRIVEAAGVPFEIIEADVLAREEICDNSPDRCYWCKRFIFGLILERMRCDGRTTLIDGTNASDDPARRPGFRALAELGVRSPLREAGLSKDEVRTRSRDMGLFTADKPNFSCYAVHVPEGARITREALAEAACATRELERAWRERAAGQKRVSAQEGGRDGSR